MILVNTLMERCQVTYMPINSIQCFPYIFRCSSCSSVGKEYLMGLSMVMEMIKLTERWSGLLKIMVYANDIVTWELYESGFEKKFQSVVTVCKNF